MHSILNGYDNGGNNDCCRHQVAILAVKTLKQCYDFLIARSARFNSPTTNSHIKVAHPKKKQEFIDFFVGVYLDNTLRQLAIDAFSDSIGGVLVDDEFEDEAVGAPDDGDEGDQQLTSAVIDDEHENAPASTTHVSSTVVLAKMLTLVANGPKGDHKGKAQQRQDEAMYSLPYASDDRDFETIERMASQSYDWQNLRFEWILDSEIFCLQSLKSNHSTYTSIIQTLGYYLNLKTVVIPSQVCRILYIYHS